MRKLIWLFCAAALLVAAGAQAISAPQSPSDPLANIRFLVGTWSCTSNMAASGAEPARTVTGTLTISEGPDNGSLHETFVAPHYEWHGFLGYNPASKAFFSSGVDNYGNADSEIGQNPSATGITFVGTSTMQGRATQIRDNRSKLSDTKIRDVSEMLQGGTWRQTAQVECNKT
jgi:hypothetical protein